MTTRNGRALIAAWRLPTLNVVNIHAAPRQVIEAQWRHVRPSADSDTLGERIDIKSEPNGES